MDKIKSITFDKEAQNNLPKEVKDKMRKDRKQAEKEQLILHGVRRSALDWFNRLTLEEQFYKTIKHNGLIAGDNTRHPSTLTGKEIETIYLADA